MENNNKTWTLAQTWKNFKPPIRPSLKTLKIAENYIDQKIKEKGNRVKILILGSTPEFRSLVISKGLIPNVVDYIEDNYRALGTLRKHKGKENYIKQDWRKLNINNKFDIILAEASITVLPKSEVLNVLKRINGLLKPNGLFLSKTWV